jgi:hypothetical protein
VAVSCIGFRITVWAKYFYGHVDYSKANKYLKAKYLPAGLHGYVVALAGEAYIKNKG